MEDTGPHVAVTGAGGKTGRAILYALSETGTRARGLIRGGMLARAPQLPHVEWVEGDMRDLVTLRALMAGVRVVYHVCPNVHPDEVQIGQRVLAVARESGARIVYHSVLHPQSRAMIHHWEKMRVEELILQSALEYTILQPAAYMQNVLTQLASILEKGEYAVPYATHTRLGMVDLADVASVAARVIQEEGHSGATYELCGREVHSCGDVADELSEVLGRSVRARPVERAQWVRAARESALSNYAIDALVAMFAYYEQYGFWGNSTVLRHLLGREPTRFGDFLRRELG